MQQATRFFAPIFDHPREGKECFCPSGVRVYECRGESVSSAVGQLCVSSRPRSNPKTMAGSGTSWNAGVHDGQRAANGWSPTGYVLPSTPLPLGVDTMPPRSPHRKRAAAEEASPVMHRSSSVPKSRLIAKRRLSHEEFLILLLLPVLVAGCAMRATSPGSPDRSEPGRSTSDRNSPSGGWDNATAQDLEWLG